MEEPQKEIARLRTELDEMTRRYEYLLKEAKKVPILKRQLEVAKLRLEKTDAERLQQTVRDLMAEIERLKKK